MIHRHVPHQGFRLRRRHDAEELRVLGGVEVAASMVATSSYTHDSVISWVYPPVLGSTFSNRAGGPTDTAPPLRTEV